MVRSSKLQTQRGVFETLRTYHGKPFEVKAHLRRLRRSARTLRIPVKLSNTALEHRLYSACRSSGESRIKLILVQSGVIIQVKPLRIDKKIYAQGVAVLTQSITRARPLVKNLNRRLEDIAFTHATRLGCADALLQDAHGRITEASRANIFYIKNHILYTSNTKILLGITRAVVLRLAKPLLSIRYHLPTLPELKQADECFMTRSSTGIMPIVKIDKTRIGNGKPGPHTQQLLREFNTYVSKTSADR